jgi:HAD superfamily hydrolase (TIGR01509 family)
MPRPQLLLFDLGGVLVENVGFERLNDLLPVRMNNDQIKNKWLASPAVRAFELGVISPEVFAQRFLEEWQISLDASEFLTAFSSWPTGFYAGAGELLAGLGRRYRLACLSNSNALHWKRFGGFREHFHLSLSSHLLGVIKPDPRCFVRAMQACGLPAEKIAFFDDSLANVASAGKLGMQAFHVCGLEELEQALHPIGVL